MGWRGYVLPRLQAKYSARVASLIVGVIWGFWHFPKFLVEGWDGSLVWFVVSTMARAVLYTWLYNSTRGSLLLVTILHAAGKVAGVFLPISNSAANQGAFVLEVILTIIVAAGVTLLAGWARLSSKPKQVQALTSEGTFGGHGFPLSFAAFPKTRCRADRVRP